MPFLLVLPSLKLIIWTNKFIEKIPYKNQVRWVKIGEESFEFLISEITL